LTHSEIVVYSSILGMLILLSAFFAAAETALMSINRYRLKHKARMKNRVAILIIQLLKRPDRLLGTILIGSTVSNISASALATLLTVHFFGEAGVLFFTVVLTLVILIFSEVAPKTVAALYPDKVSKWVARPIYVLLKVFYPLVWLVNTVANGFLRLLRVRFSNDVVEPLSREELRNVVYEANGKVTHQYQSMLLGILDLNKVTVDDVMIPRHEIAGIDLDADWEVIFEVIAQSKHEWMPVYRENINHVMGVLHVRELINATLTSNFNQQVLMKLLHEPYFIPVGTLLNIQLQNFQQHHQRLAMIVDEYGEIQGLLTLKDILEEIVGEFTSSVAVANSSILLQPDGSYLIDGSVTIRELIKVTKWRFPLRGPRTLSGLIIENLESIPKVGTCLKVADYPIEVIDVNENRVKTARIFPKLRLPDLE
jgi:Mg2+/Co2+ transporter CorB